MKSIKYVDMNERIGEGVSAEWTSILETSRDASYARVGDAPSRYGQKRELGCKGHVSTKGKDRWGFGPVLGWEMNQDYFCDTREVRKTIENNE